MIKMEHCKYNTCYCNQAFTYQLLALNNSSSVDLTLNKPNQINRM